MGRHPLNDVWPSGAGAEFCYLGPHGAAPHLTDGNYGKGAIHWRVKVPRYAPFPPHVAV
jgi:hypothetical protein